MIWVIAHTFSTLYWVIFLYKLKLCFFFFRKKYFYIFDKKEHDFLRLSRKNRKILGSPVKKDMTYLLRMAWPPESAKNFICSKHGLRYKFFIQNDNLVLTILWFINPLIFSTNKSFKSRKNWKVPIESTFKEEPHSYLLHFFIN